MKKVLTHSESRYMFLAIKPNTNMTSYRLYNRVLFSYRHYVVPNLSHNVKGGCICSVICSVLSALCSASKHAISKLPDASALWTGVEPSRSWAAASAPCSTRKHITAIAPEADATCNGVEPSLSWAVGSAPCSTSKRGT